MNQFFIKIFIYKYLLKSNNFNKYIDLKYLNLIVNDVQNMWTR